MRSSFHRANPVSPESTVTSLLSSSGHLTSDLQPPGHLTSDLQPPGHLTSDLQPPGHSSSFFYNHKGYVSASSALDSYITDFERSRGRGLSGAGLVLPPSTPRRTALGTLRNKDVLRERLSEEELDFLSLPVSSLRHPVNRERTSMTTDELLELPNDGSMPITHTTAFIHSMLSRSGESQRPGPGLKHTPRAERPIQTLRCSRCGGGGHFSKTSQSLGTTWPQGAGPASAPPLNRPISRDQATMHLPHWLSANKAALDCPEIHSLPDLPYPPWIRHCHDGQSESGHTQWGQSEIPDDPGRAPTCKQGQSQDGEIEDFPASAPSWVQDLAEDELQGDSERSLKQLRLQFAEHISHLASDRTTSVDSLFRHGEIQRLIQKADRVLDSLQTSATGSPVPPESQDQTEELLLRDLEPNMSRSDQPSLEVDLQPGVFEALKQIVFRLQAVEAELQRRHDAQQTTLLPDSEQQGALLQTTLLPDSEQQGAAQESPHLPEAQLTDDQSSDADGGPSLRRALLHLSRLKLLVQEPPAPASAPAPSLQKPARTEDEERDEGRYSSSSTEQQQGTPPSSQPLLKKHT